MSHGFTVKLIAPQFVKPYVKSNKNDAVDAAAIAEAMSRPHMGYVAANSLLIKKKPQEQSMLYGLFVTQLFALPLAAGLAFWEGEMFELEILIYAALSSICSILYSMRPLHEMFLNYENINQHSQPIDHPNGLEKY